MAQSFVFYGIPSKICLPAKIFIQWFAIESKRIGEGSEGVRREYASFGGSACAYFVRAYLISMSSLFPQNENQLMRFLFLLSAATPTPTTLRNRVWQLFVITHFFLCVCVTTAATKLMLFVVWQINIREREREEEFLAPGHVWLGIYLMEICRGLIEQPSIVAVARNDYKAFIN